MDKKEYRKLEKVAKDVIGQYNKYIASLEQKYQRELAKREAKIRQLEQQIKEQRKQLKNQQQQMKRRKEKYEKLATAIKADRAATQAKTLASMRHTKDFGESVGTQGEKVTISINSPILIDKILEGDPPYLSQSTKETLRNSASFQAAFWAKAHQRGMSTKEAQVAGNNVFGSYEDVGEIKTDKDDKRFKKTKFYT